MTMWFSRTAGNPAALGETDPNSVLIGHSKPDWVRLPPELGGRQVQCMSQEAADCPQCQKKRPVRTLVLVENLRVAECDPCGFVFYRTKGS